MARIGSVEHATRWPDGMYPAQVCMRFKYGEQVWAHNTAYRFLWANGAFTQWIHPP